MKKGKIFQEMQHLAIYFQRHIPRNPLFVPEFDTASKINAIIERSEQLDRSAVVEIVRLYNELNAIAHHGGSGWFDYKLHLVHLLKHNGYMVREMQNELFLETSNL